MILECHRTYLIRVVVWVDNRETLVRHCSATVLYIYLDHPPQRERKKNEKNDEYKKGNPTPPQTSPPHQPLIENSYPNLAVLIGNLIDSNVPCRTSSASAWVARLLARELSLVVSVS